MCQNQAEGGMRCASHTRPAYQNAPFGTAQWDEAAAAYASTPTGRMELLGSHAASEEAGDIASVVAFTHALATGQRLREKSELIRTELAAYAAPVLAPVALVAMPDVAEYEGYHYDDEEERAFDHEATDYDDCGSAIDDDDDTPTVAWSPDMRGQRWSPNDTAFAGCSPTMTSDQFVNRVCENVGVSRAEFEAAAAEYLANNSVHLLAPNGTGMVEFGFTGGGSGLNAAQLRTALRASATPRFNPQQVKEIAELALRQRTATAPAPADAVVATGEETTPVPAGRPAHLVLPDDPAELAELARSDDEAIRAAVAGHPNTSEAVLNALASDPKVKVRAAAARNENLPLSILRTLAADRLVTVRAGAARNPALPGEYLVRLAEDTNDSVVGAVARNPSTHPALYAALAAHDSAGVRKHAARRKNIPANIATRLAADSDQQVRSTLARNRTTTPEDLRTLSRDSTQSVRAAAAKNPNLPPALLRGRLSRDPAAGVRAAVARNPNTSVAVLARLSTDTDPWVRRNVVWNESSPAVLLYALSYDTDDGVRTSAGNRNAQHEQDRASA